MIYHRAEDPQAWPPLKNAMNSYCSNKFHHAGSDNIGIVGWKFENIPMKKLFRYQVK